MGGASSTHGGDKTCEQILVGKFEGKNSLEKLLVDGKLIFKYILMKWG
jgi:hypothetical protein